MLWECANASGTGNLIKVEGILKKEIYAKILKENLKQSSAKLGLGRRFVAPGIDWPVQNPDLNPIEYLWGELMTKDHDRIPLNLEQLERFAKEE